jgi:alpha-amylase
MTDRFYNGESNDTISTELKLRENCVVLKEVILRESQKNWRRLFWQIRINAIWFTPIVEQIHDAVDEGTGLLSFHGIGQEIDGFRPQLWNKQT